MPNSRSNNTHLGIRKDPLLWGGEVRSTFNESPHIYRPVRFDALRLILCLSLFSASLIIGCDDEPSPIVESAGGDAKLTSGEEPISGAEGGAETGSQAGEPAGGSGGTDDPPSHNEGVSIEGLNAPVRVLFDELGVLHVKCSTPADCFAAQGYYHAAHRFVQMDINRLFPQGRLTERVGDLVLGTDRASRTLFATRDGGRIEDTMWEASTPETRQMLEAYTRGVNAWLDDWRAGRNGAQMSEEYDYFLFNTSLIEPWTPKDSLSVALILIQQLTDTTQAQINDALRLEEVGPELYHDLYGSTPAFPTSILSGSEGVDALADLSEMKDSPSDSSTPGVSLRLTALESVYKRLSQAKGALKGSILSDHPRLFGDDYGSNNWVVAPERASAEVALLANDPHLGLSNPAVWYLAHLKVDPPEGGESPLNVQGVSLPGIPSIIIGHNEKIAWGMTTTYFDFTDVYIETLNDDHSAVLFNDQEVPIITRVDEFKFPDGSPSVEHTRSYVPHHGPILDIDEDEGIAITTRWTAQDADRDVNFLFLLARSSSVAEAREALKSITTIGQNVVVADVDGHIGWFPYNRLPHRPWASLELDPAFPLPGTGEAEWGEPIPYEDLPQLVDPDLGLIATANHDMTGSFWDGDPTDEGAAPDNTAYQISPANGYRYSQIMRLLDRPEPHTVESLNEIIHDREVIIARRLLPLILSMVTPDDLSAYGALVYESLIDWDYECPAGVSLVHIDESTPVESEVERRASAACLTFHTLYGQLSIEVFSDELSGVPGFPKADYEALARLLARPEVLIRDVSYWDDTNTEGEEDMSHTITAGFNRAGRVMAEEFGDDPALWLWGQAHTFSLSANLLADAGIRNFNSGPYPNHGGLYSVDVANPRNLYTRNFNHSSGPSMRFICELTAPPRCTIELPGGQRHLRDSPHYGDLLELWLSRTPSPLAFSDEAVEERAEERVMISPHAVSP